VNVVVVGGGVAGLATAVQLGRAGRVVTVIERDDTDAGKRRRGVRVEPSQSA
jgi:2-polyprenyl-6-methoxyphenol hydroxylase-like FAD-dependent oxidoreductase